MKDTWGRCREFLIDNWFVIMAALSLALFLLFLGYII
jgi:hypothetical protein